MPTGVWMPVLCIMTGARIGCTHVFTYPTVCSALSISATSLSFVIPFRHFDFGCSRTVVSIIVSGAGSVDVSARLIFPKTRSTSGNCFSFLSICCNTHPASRLGKPGRVDGMYRIEPSSVSGRKSLPMPFSKNTAAMTARSPAPVKACRCLIISLRADRYHVTARLSPKSSAVVLWRWKIQTTIPALATKASCSICSLRSPANRLASTVDEARTRAAMAVKI